MKILKYCSFLLLAIAFSVSYTSCIKDTGNYTYSEINRLEEITNMPDTLTAFYGSQFKFSPDVKFNKDQNFDQSKYDYEWSYIGPNGLGGTKLFIFNENKDVDMIVTSIVAGTYQAYFSVTDKETGVKFRTPFRLIIKDEFNEGWIMMNEANGKPRIDMLSLNSEGNAVLVLDLLSKVGSDLELKGKPEMIYNYPTGLLIGPDKISHGLYVGTDEMTTKIEPNTFKWTPTMGLQHEMFGEYPTGFYASIIKQKSTWSAYLIGKGDAYYYDRVMNIYFSAPINYINEERVEFEVAPFVYAPTGVFYDITNRRFVKHTGAASSSTVIPDPSDNKLFSFKTGMDLKYMKGVSFNGGEIFSILKSPNSDLYYLARFNARSNAQTYYAEILNNDIKNAEFFEVNPEFGYIFYAVGGKLYQYDMIYKTTKLMIDIGNNRISYLRFYEFINTNKYKDGNKLMLGFYDPNISNGTEGRLNIYTVPGLNGDLVLNKSYSGFGRIKDLTYRER
ncbi:PKD-like family lipoprotein [Sphingobacterium bovistauri]|uniref:PKD-like family protein n=1 Tax=Sphingobacterium bovistauri TaxID=2781959 RepID=A0ABS7ZAA5_9SPHI|nr:PKD-like family lipoprotein [Sphingobacterium bovistauri]MCA5005639.1 hypothetical protein [Sphingobacterium bovistauri]